jgi:hypothetical protein
VVYVLGGWPWVFYVNLAPGMLMLAALWYALPKSATQLGLLRHGDWPGIALMAVGLAAFQTVLDDGNVYNWFASPFIVKLSILAALALVGFVLWQFLTPKPLVNLRLLGRRNFGLGTLGNFLLGRLAQRGGSWAHRSGLAANALDCPVGVTPMARRHVLGHRGVPMVAAGTQMSGDPLALQKDLNSARPHTARRPRAP